MKVIISGPRRLWQTEEMLAGKPWPHLHVELDLPALPADGEHIILNNGSVYTVKRRMWWVDSPEDEAYWTWDADYRTDEGRYQTAYIDVLPSEYDEPFTYDKAITEGITRGRENMAAEVEKLLDLADQPGVDPASALTMVHQLVRAEADAARKREAEAERHRAVVEKVLNDLLAERQGVPEP